MSRSRRRRLQLFRAIVFLVLGAFFLVPIGAMFEFSTRGNALTAPRNLDAWKNIVQTPDLTEAITASLELAAITCIAMLVLLLPTMVWVRLRFPGLSRVIEFICLIPLTVPAIALVVGMVPIYRWIEINVTDSILILSFAYLILVLPYSYLRVVVPNMSSALLNASLLAVALVLGEFTFANLLFYENLQVAIAYVGLVSATTSVAVAVAALLFAFTLLLILSFVRSRSGTAAADPADIQIAQPLAASGAIIGRAR